MVSIGDISPKVAKERRVGIIAEQNHEVFFPQKLHQCISMKRVK
jgi:hypothetical protein